MRDSQRYSQRLFPAGRPLAVVTLLCLLSSTALAENWPQWRGPTNNGLSNETNLPTTWSKTKNVAWRTPLPGIAGSTPCVWGDRIFLTSVDGNDQVLLCLSTDGKLLWREKLTQGDKMMRRDEGNLASPSPSTDGKHVWAFIGNGVLACYTIDGKQVWKIDVQDRYGKLDIAFGMSSTPVLDGNRLYVQLIHGDGNPKTREAAVVALEAATGKEIWKHSRQSEAHTENEHSYASPMLYNDDKTRYLLTHGADYTTAHRLSDGSEIWRCFLNSRTEYHPTLRFVSSPATAPGIIVIPTAKRGKTVALKPDGQGDITDDESVRHWTRPKNTPDVPSPLIHEGLVYLCTEEGNLYCIDAKTGEEFYAERTHRHRYRASPVYADGKIYLTARDGKITIVKAGRQFKILAQNDTDEVQTASPVISGGTIYLRTWDALWAIRQK